MSSSDSDTSYPRVVCAYCKKTYANKKQLSKHLKTHVKTPIFFHCYLCNIGFKSKDLLECHLSKKHDIHTIPKMTHKKVPEPRKRKGYKDKKVCDGCKKMFRYTYQLEYHIRKVHFNLISRPPYCTLLDINETWYETVLNTNFHAELRKYNANTLYIRRVNDANVKPFDTPRDLTDLRLVYNTSTKSFPCVVCSELFHGKDLTNHVMENHEGVVKKWCAKCNSNYLMLSTRLGHICPV